MKSLIFNILFCLLALLSYRANSQEERHFIREGNQLYEKKKYNEAEIKYRKAIEKNNRSFEAKFNMGDALYKQGNYKEALKVWQELLQSTTDKDKLEKLHYNIGNIYLKTNKLKESINSYINALKLNPDDKEAKYNLSVALQKLKKQQQQQKQNQQNKKQNQNKQNKNNKKKNDKKKENKNKQNQQNKNKDKKDKQQQKKQQQQPQNQQKKKQQQQKQGMNKKDAQRILNALQQNENKLQKKIKAKQLQQQKANRIKIEKDW